MEQHTSPALNYQPMVPPNFPPGHAHPRATSSHHNASSRSPQQRASVQRQHQRRLSNADRHRPRPRNIEPSIINYSPERPSYAMTPGPSGSPSTIPTNRHRTTVAPLGTREEAEDPNYQSPVGAMFNRAWDRYRVAEETRRVEANLDYGSTFEPHQQSFSQNMNPFANTSATNRTYPEIPYPMATPQHWVPHATWGFDHPLRNQNMQYPNQAPPLSTRPPNPFPNHNPLQAHQNSSALPPGVLQELDANAMAIQADARARHQIRMSIARRFSQNPRVSMPTELDSQPPIIKRLTVDEQTRPKARASEDLTVDMTCKICMEQICDVVLLPCRHLYLCHWCADICYPARSPQRPDVPSDRNAKCNICRKTVKHRYQVFLPGADTHAEEGRRATTHTETGSESTQHMHAEDGPRDVEMS